MPEDSVTEEQLLARLQDAMDFGRRFVPALVKLVAACDRKEGITLTAQEAEALLEGMKVMRDGAARALR